MGYRQPNDQTAAQLDALKRDGWLTSWFVRDPVARLLSVYQHFTNRERRFRQSGFVYSVSWAIRAANADGRLYESIETFCERAFNDFPTDKHIAPQTGWGAEVCEVIAPLERSAEAPTPVALPHINSTACGDSVLETPQSVRTFYANDIAYWTRVCADFNSEHLSARRPNVDGEPSRQKEVVRADAV